MLYFFSITFIFWVKNIHEYKWGRIYCKYLILWLCNKSNLEHIPVTEVYSAKFEDTS